MLNDQELKYLESYCVMNGVKYYDLQLEVIDHMATVIEDVQQKAPSINFKEALELANSQFKKSDFSLMIKSKKYQLQKKVSRLIEKEFISFFTVPKIILTAVLYLSAWVFTHNLTAYIQKNELIGVIGFGLLMIPFFYYSIRYRREIKSLREDRDINLLCLKIRSKYEIIAIASVLLVNVVFNIVVPMFDVHFKKSPTFTFILILFLVTLELLYIAILHVRFAFNNKMRDEYPAVFQSAL
ncbi:MAG: hypothetical protein QM726_09750 [Chitinophagaceae bacterium]